MSKKTTEVNDLQTLTLSPTSTNDEESTLIPQTKEEIYMSSTPASSYTNQVNLTSRQLFERKKVEKSNSIPSGSSRAPSFKLSAPNNPENHSHGSNNNEEKTDLPKVGPDRPPPPTQTPSFGNKKELIVGSEAHGSPIRPPRRGLLHHGITDLSQSRLYGSRNLLISKGGRPLERPKRPVQHHSFLTDAADVKQIEEGLLQLMEDFQTGNLRAFGKDSRLRQMEAIREQQEELAKLHFEVGAEQDLYPPLSEEGVRISVKNKKLLMEKLAQLSVSIENLHKNSNSERKASTTERKYPLQASSNITPTSHHQTNSHTSNSQVHNTTRHSSPYSHHSANQSLQATPLAFTHGQSAPSSSLATNPTAVSKSGNVNNRPTSVTVQGHSGGY